jgi:hypothetical protein
MKVLYHCLPKVDVVGLFVGGLRSFFIISVDVKFSAVSKGNFFWIGFIPLDAQIIIRSGLVPDASFVERLFVWHRYFQRKGF